MGMEGGLFNDLNSFKLCAELHIMIHHQKTLPSADNFSWPLRQWRMEHWLGFCRLGTKLWGTGVRTLGLLSLGTSPWGRAWMQTEE